MNTTTTTSYFKRLDDATCRKARLSPPWSAPNRILCFAECVRRFQNRCRNVLYNTGTSTCTPVYPLAEEDPILESQPGDVHYSLAEERIVDCDTAAGFEIRHECGAVACVLLGSSAKTFSDAKAYCQSRGATLFVPSTYERFALLERLAPGPAETWVGLTKSGRTIVWEQGGYDTLDPEYSRFMWSPGQPNHLTHQNCVVFRYRGYLHKLQDDLCTPSYNFICERNA